MGFGKSVQNWWWKRFGHLGQSESPEQAHPSACSDDPSPKSLQSSSRGPTPPLTGGVDPPPGPPHPAFYPEPRVILATTPFGRETIEDAGLYSGETERLSGVTSASSLVETPTGEEAHPNGRLKVFTSDSSPLGPRVSQNSLRQGHHSSVLSGAHNFSVDRMDAIEVQNVRVQNAMTQYVAVQYQLHTGANSLEKMLPYVMPGADLDSDARDPPPRCCEDTRSRICADLQDQVNDKARLIWVHGQAGVGKSAIMRTLAEMVSPKTPCATLFLSHYSWPPRDDLEKVFPTLAYSLAAANGGYRKYIEERISLDPTFFLEKSPEQQFNQLFLIPFANRRVQTGLQRWVVLVDGLDECKNKGDDQRRIVDLLCNFILKHSEDTPFVWVIASRTDGDLLFELKEKFQDHAAKFWEREITISSDDDAIRDILQYLRTEFPKIQKKYSNPPPNHPSNWPSEGDLLKVAKASSGLFVFASTLTKYISADHPVSHQSTPIDKPVSRFSSILTLIDKCMHRPTIVPQGAFGLLDKLYTQIMADIPEEKLPAAKSLLGFFRLVDVVIIQRSLSKERVGLIGACNILGLLQDEAYDTLLKLHCVLTCPSPKTAQVGGIQFPDASFPDFLLDYSRSGNCYMDWDNALTRNYHVDLDKELTNIWQCYIEIIKGSCRSNLNLMNHGEVDIHWAPDDDDTLRDRLQKELLWRAQHGWVSLLMEYGHSQCASCPRPANGRRLDIDATTLVKAFQDIHPVLFSGDKFPVERFVDWLDNHTPKAVRDSMISQRFPLNELDTERLFRSLCARPWCRYATGAYVQDINIAAAVKGLDVSQWSHAKEALWTTSGSLSNLVMAVETGKTKCRQPCTVTVVGVEQSGLYAVIGPIAKSDYYRKAFYVFPYSAEYSKDRIM